MIGTHSSDWLERLASHARGHGFESRCVHHTRGGQIARRGCIFIVCPYPGGFADALSSQKQQWNQKADGAGNKKRLPRFLLFLMFSRFKTNRTYEGGLFMAEQLKGACIIGQSGGPTSVINAVRTA